MINYKYLIYHYGTTMLSSLTAPVETLTSPVQTTESEFNEEENSRMQMNVQIGGSLRPHGNTAAMVAAFTKGAQENGHAVFGLAFPSGCEVNDGAEQFLPYTRKNSENLFRINRKTGG